MSVPDLDVKPIATVVRLSAHFLSMTKGVACLLTTTGEDEWRDSRKQFRLQLPRRPTVVEGTYR